MGLETRLQQAGDALTKVEETDPEGADTRPGHSILYTRPSSIEPHTMTRDFSYEKALGNPTVSL